MKALDNWFYVKFMQLEIGLFLIIYVEMLKVHGSLLCIKYNFCAVHHRFLMDTRTWQILLTSCERHKKHYNSPL